MVTVVPSMHFCIMRWLPRWRTARSPFLSRMWHTSEPDGTRTLPNRNLDLGHEDFAAKPASNFGWVGRLEKERESFD